MNLPRCPYSECYLPENNNRYFFQLVYLVISLGVLIASPEQFNFFSLTLYIAPILMDLFGTSLNELIAQVIRGLYITYNLMWIIFVLLGMFHIINDNGQSFSVVESALLLNGFSIDKKVLAFVLVPEVLIPVLFWVGAPNKRKLQRMKETREARKPVNR